MPFSGNNSRVTPEGGRCWPGDLRVGRHLHLVGGKEERDGEGESRTGSGRTGGGGLGKGGLVGGQAGARDGKGRNGGIV